MGEQELQEEACSWVELQIRALKLGHLKFEDYVCLKHCEPCDAASRVKLMILLHKRKRVEIVHIPTKWHEQTSYHTETGRRSWGYMHSMLLVLNVKHHAYYSAWHH